jgi:hypothetical protein
MGKLRPVEKNHYNETGESRSGLGKEGTLLNEVACGALSGVPLSRQQTGGTAATKSSSALYQAGGEKAAASLLRRSTWWPQPFIASECGGGMFWDSLLRIGNIIPETKHFRRIHRTRASLYRV